MRKLLVVRMLTILLSILLTLKPTVMKAPNFSHNFLTLRFNKYFHNVFVPERNKQMQYVLDSISSMELERFLNDLGYEESRNNWKITNKYGYLGEWQIGYTARKHTGFAHITYKGFLKNPFIFPRDQQKIAVKRLLILNQQTLIRKKSYYEYINSTIKGIKITESALLAASHLGGAGNVINFLESKGKIDFADAFGTTISDYMIRFNNYKFNI